MPPSPFVILGTPGSGIRIAAHILRRANVQFSADPGDIEDAPAFSSFFDKFLQPYLEACPWPLLVVHAKPIPPLPESLLAEMRQHFQSALALHQDSLPNPETPFAWKHPRSIYFLPFLIQQVPKLRALHILRDGRDSAYTPAQLQLARDLKPLLGQDESMLSPSVQSVLLWARINVATAFFAPTKLGPRYLRIKFENFAKNPEPNVRRIFSFATGNDPTPAQLEATLPEIPPQRSLAGFKQQKPSELPVFNHFAQQAIHFFRYPVNPCTLRLHCAYHTERSQPIKLGFLIAGTEKAGTTSLDAYLRQHPSLCMATPKELHFFDNDRLFAKGGRPDYTFYHQHFDLSRKDAPSVLFGEATPAYTYWLDAPRRIWEYNPDIKLIVLLRNPIKRAHSHWAMEIRRGTEPLQFSQAIREEPHRLQSTLPGQNRLHSYIDRGFYSEQIRRLDRFFPRSQVLYIKAEDFFKNPAPELEKIFCFLNIVPHPLDTSDVFNPGISRDPISPEDHQYLLEIFRTDIEQTQSLLNWSCPDWLAPAAPARSAAPDPAIVTER